MSEQPQEREGNSTRPSSTTLPPATPRTEYSPPITNSEDRRTPSSSMLNGTPPTSDITAILQLMMSQINDLSQGTIARFNELAAAQNDARAQIADLQASRSQESRGPATRPTAEVLSDLQRNLFGSSGQTDATPAPRAQTNPSADTFINTMLPPATVAQERRDDTGNRELESLRKQLAEMTSKIHQATSSAPEIAEVLKASRNTPFTDRIVNTVVRPQGKMHVPTYDGQSDPARFLSAFHIGIQMFHFPPEDQDAAQCKLFVGRLTDAALQWFSRLNANSIDSYDQLTTAFLKHYSIHIQDGISDADLYTLQQGPKETLRSFTDRFKAVASQIAVGDNAAISALKNALWHESPFKHSIILNKPNTLEDALHRAAAHIELEETKAAAAKKYAPQPQRNIVPVKEKSSGEYREPRQHYDGNYRQEFKGKQAPVFQIGAHRPNPGWNKYVRPDQGSPSGNEKPFCTHHNFYGHTTNECRQLHEQLYHEYQKKKRPPHRQNSSPRNEAERFRQIQGDRQRDDEEQQRQRKQIGHDMIPPNQGKDELRTADNPPAVRRRVNMIMGGLTACNDSVRSIKEYGRKAIAPQRWKHGSEPYPRTKDVISFDDSDLDGLDMPHNDPLIIEVQIGDCEVSRVMIDTGSTVDLLFKDTLDRMQLTGFELKPRSTPLTGFGGDSIMTIGTIKLPVSIGGVTRIVKFAVIDRPTIYNIILGGPWLYSMKAVPSTYHQCLKFPGPNGVVTIRGNQRLARTCFITEHKIRHSERAYVINLSNVTTGVDNLSTEESHLEEVEQVNIDPSDPERCVGIGTYLEQTIREQLVAFLKANASTFAWKTEDMKGIDPSIASHELNVDPTHKPVKQKRRKLGPERAKAVNDEVERLSKAGSITEVKYPEWLANPVVVKKKNGKWRVCVDFTDLNKACPKDSFPLPHIDRLVEATAGNELLSFMDAFSGYNQIMMHPDDREKTAFVTERGTYCYKVMPFGLKNAGATYQRLVNRMFADQLGKTMEVYIDDMLVKSEVATDHIDHLAACFKSLNQYGMKLNPTKCTFAVTSGEFLGHIVTKRGIEANPKKIAAIRDLPSPRNPREVQQLTGRIAALTRFISRSTDRCLPFYQLLKANKKFEWDARCEDAFKQLKDYLSTPPVLVKPEDGETLYLYIAVSTSAVSGVLVREDRGEQKPIFYTSKTLDDAETRYPTMEKLALAVVTCARKLRPYFQSHSIAVLSDHPLRSILHSPSQSGRLAKWAIELSEYDIEYKNRTCAKSQVLADFIIELPPEQPGANPTTPKNWSLFVDGSSSRHGSGVGVRLVSPTGEILEQSFRLAFPASNNEAEYEAIIAGLRLAKGIGARHVHAYCDSQLVASQFNGEYEAKNDRMDAYLKVVQEIAKEFDNFELTKIPRSDNSSADALAALASTSDPDLKRMIPVETIDRPSIDRTDHALIISEVAIDVDEVGESTSEPMDAEPEDGQEEDWRTPIINYIADGEIPRDKWAARRLKARSAYYTMLDGNLFRWSASNVLLSCVGTKDVRGVMIETHEGAGGNHSGGRSLALKIKKHGLFWPTMTKDCEDFVARCEQCQRHAPIIHQPTELLASSAAPYPFMRWAMDIVGPFPASKQKRFLLVMTDYFTKWVEAESYATIKDTDVKKFVWKNIICRHGLPYEIVTDNGSQFISAKFEDFCAKWKIRVNNSTPRYPQGNGQAEATNKTIVAGLKKRLDSKKGKWAEELDGVLWSYRTTPRSATNRTPFSLSHGMEAMSPAEVGLNALRRQVLPNDTELNSNMILNHLDNLEEERQHALLRIQNYQQAAARWYNKSVRGRNFVEGDLVLRKVYDNTKEDNAGKLGANWEGPYIISKIIRRGVYELVTTHGEAIPRPWNSANLKRYYY